MSSVGWALRYLRAGVSVVPADRLKRPLLDAWTPYMERQPMLQEIRDWWTTWPWAGVAIVCGAVSDVVVVDIEGEAIWVLDEEPLPYTPKVRTPSGGVHLYYRYEPGVRSTTWSEDGRHIGEIRSDGNLVMAPPSRVVDGPYVWQVPPWEREPGEPPTDLFGRLGAIGAGPGGEGQPNVARAGNRRQGGYPSHSEEDQAIALRMVCEGAEYDDIAAELEAGSAYQRRGKQGGRYIRRTIWRAHAWAEANVPPARIERVVRRADGYDLMWLVQSGPHEGRRIRLAGLEWPPRETASERWAALLSACGVEHPSQLPGRVARIELLRPNEGQDYLRVHRIFPSLPEASGTHDS